VMDAKIILSKEDCALGTEQRNYAAV